MTNYLLTNIDISKPDLRDYQNIVIVNKQDSTVVPLEIVNNTPYDNSGAFFKEILITSMVISQLMIFFYLLISGGIEHMTSRGNKVNEKMARNKIKYALIGLGIVVIVCIVIMLLILFILPSTGFFEIPTNL